MRMGHGVVRTDRDFEAVIWLAYKRLFDKFMCIIELRYDAVGAHGLLSRLLVASLLPEHQNVMPMPTAKTPPVAILLLPSSSEMTFSLPL
jgi:hypothetical protein